VPRTGLTGAEIVAAAAVLADENGFAGVTMGLLAERLGIRPPSLYKHVASLADLQHRVATLAMIEVGEQIRDAVQGKAERDALAALLTALRGYVTDHPGRYMATVGATEDGLDDPLVLAAARVIDSIAAVLRGYGLGDAEMTHAIRFIRSAMHGFAMLEISGGFQWDTDPDESFAWMIGFIDRGLRTQEPARQAGWQAELARQPDAADAPADHRQVNVIPGLPVQELADPAGEVGPGLRVERDHRAVGTEQAEQLF
jgi:AcrR family transcriptional regulator